MFEKLQKEQINLADWEYQYQQRGEQPISLCDFFTRSLERYFYTELDAATRHTDYLYTDSFKGYHDPMSTVFINEILAARAADRTALRGIISNSIDIPRRFSAVADRISKETAGGEISNEKLAELWALMDEGFLKVIPWFYYPWYLSGNNYLTDKVAAGLERHKANVEKLCPLDEAVLILSFPEKKTGFQLEQYEMRKLVLIAQDDASFAESPVFQEAAQEYLRKFDWLTTFILTPALPMTYAQLVERVQRAVDESFLDTLELQEAASQKNESLAVQILDHIKDDSELIDDITDARDLCYALTAGIEEAYIVSARCLPFMQVVAERIGVAFDDSKRLFSCEVLDALTHHATIDPLLMEERRKGFVVMMRDGVQYALFGDEGHAVSQWIDTELNKVDMDVQELKGQVACKGSAQGVVRIALSPDEAHVLDEGEILVCPMTNPDYVPAMRRCAAIVTDEGGLLSHAAIMSREFGKPCVIATKTATKVLKTGDLVEVDAERGVVRILERG